MHIGSNFLEIMCNSDININKIDEKLATLRYICDNKTHITLDIAKCKKCESKNLE